MKKNIFQRSFFKGALLLLSGLFLGWLFFHHSENAIKNASGNQITLKTIYTCAMHPDIRKDGPGVCPICGMDLIPLEQLKAETNNDVIQMDEEAIKLASIQTSLVQYRKATKVIRLNGKIQVDERRIQTITAHIPGRIEKLFLNFKGEQVRPNQKIALIYSPELLNAQQELIESISFKESNPPLYNAAREKLRLWKLSEEQIQAIETNKKVQENFEISSQFDGIVLSRNVSKGDYVSKGQALFEIADLQNVWLMFDIYESDLSAVKTGAEVNFTVQGLDGMEFKGLVTYIDPVINPQTRVARARVELQNEKKLFKPEMFVTGEVSSAFDQNKSLLIPKSAILWTGKRSIVYIKDVEQKIPSFIKRNIVLGPESGEWYIVISGLKNGEEIVTNGAFVVDAAAQLAGKSSMLNSSDTVNSINNN